MVFILPGESTPADSTCFLRASMGDKHIAWNAMVGDAMIMMAEWEVEIVGHDQRFKGLRLYFAVSCTIRLL